MSRATSQLNLAALLSLLQRAGWSVVEAEMGRVLRVEVRKAGVVRVAVALDREGAYRTACRLVRLVDVLGRPPNQQP